MRTAAIRPWLMGRPATRSASRGISRIPASVASPKYNPIRTTTQATPDNPELPVPGINAMEIERNRITGMSSNTAALSSATPSRLRITLISINVCAEMLTLVAARISPMNSPEVSPSPNKIAVPQAHQHRKDDAECPGQRRDLSRSPQLTQVYFQSSHEHKEDHPQLGEMGNGFAQMRIREHRPVNHVQGCWTQEQANE